MTVEAVLHTLRAESNPARAAWDRAYLKLPDLEFLGTTLPTLRTCARNCVPSDPTELKAFVDKAWSTGVWDLRAVAVVGLQRHQRRLGEADLVWLEDLLRKSFTWAVIDAVAVHVVGPIVHRNSSSLLTLDRWATDSDFWVRRPALLALLWPLRKTGNTDVDRLLRWCDTFANEREFFLRKAAGWALRELGRRQPDTVDAWVEPRLAQLNAVTFREAVKPLPAERRTVLTAAWKTSRSTVKRPARGDEPPRR